MNNLNELIGQNIYTTLSTYSYGEITIEGVVKSVWINDFYYQEKDDRISILVNIQPLEDLPEGVDYDLCNDIPIENIRKCWK